MEQELWYRMREQQLSGQRALSGPHCDQPPHPVSTHLVERSRRLVGRAVVRVGGLIAAERYVPATR